MPPSALSKADVLRRLARQGPLRARDLERAGIPRSYLARLVARGELEQVARGLYRAPDTEATELHSLAGVSLRVPHATVCLLSALQVHGLTTEVPHAVWIMIDTRARAEARHALDRGRAGAWGRARARRRASSGRGRRGVDHESGEDRRGLLPVPTPRRHGGGGRRAPGLPRAFTAARSSRACDIDALVAAAQADRVGTVLRPYLEALA